MYKVSKHDNILIEDARITFKNFSGVGGQYNPEGRRNFTVLLDKDAAAYLRGEGWNVRTLTPKDPSDEPQDILQVFLNYKCPERFRPKVVLMQNGRKSVLDEDSVSILDWADIETVDIMIRPYNWEMAGKTGIKAMVSSLYASVVPDELELKYYDVPDSAQDAIGGCGNCEECDGHCHQ